MISKYIVFATVAALIVLSGCVGASYKDCGTDEACLETAMKTCTPATGSIRVGIATSNPTTYDVTIEGYTSSVCEVNYKSSSKDVTCLIPDVFAEEAGNKYHMSNYLYDFDLCT